MVLSDCTVGRDALSGLRRSQEWQRPGGQISTETSIWFDESGFTGEDLLKSEQRHFTRASSTIGDEEAETILHACFPRYAGREFKFSTLWRGTRHRAGLLRFAGRLCVQASARPRSMASCPYPSG